MHMANQNHWYGRQLSYCMMLEFSCWFMVVVVPAARHTPAQRLKPKSRTAVGEEHWEDHWNGKILACLDRRLSTDTNPSKLRILFFETGIMNSIIPALSYWNLLDKVCLEKALSAQKKTRCAFKLYDHDGTGSISQPNLRKAMAMAMGQRKCLA